MALGNLFPKRAKKPKDPNTPTLLEVIRKDAIILVNWIFSTNEAGGYNRRWLLIISGALLWAWGAYQLYPYSAEETTFVAYPFEALFSPPVFRHVLIVLITIFNAIQMTARYIDDVFELGNPLIAERYIMQASLAGRYELIEVKDGKLLSNPDSPVIKIGGPGLVKVHMDSAALFEKYDGAPTVIDTTDGLVALDRFERLRKTISIRDHVDETTITARTKDGINVIASGVRIKYHIFRGSNKPTMQVPYPVDKQAVQTLIYKENVFKYIEPGDHQPRTIGRLPNKTEHFEVLEVKSGYFLGKLKNFIANATLSEFLARISQREIEKEAQEAEELSPTQPFTPDETETGPTDSAPPESMATTQTKRTEAFYPRDEITQMIYAQNDPLDRKSSGMELDWIDIGTWEFPENAQTIAEQHREAWQVSLKNLSSKSPQKFNRIRNESKLETMHELLHEIVFTIQGQAQTSIMNPAKAIEKILQSYYAQLVLAAEYYQSRGERPPEPLAKVIQHLDEILMIRHWL